MREEKDDTEEVPPRFAWFKARVAWFKKAALRMIDACLRPLQKLRQRLEPEEDDARDRRRGAKPEEETPPTPPRRIGFFTGLLILFVCLLVGNATGTWGAYRFMERVLDLRAAQVDRLRDDLNASQKDQARSVNQMARFQKENGELRLQMRDAQRTMDDDQTRIADLEKQLAAAKRVERPVAAAAPHAPHKSGTCAVGTGNPGADLTNCIEQFNQQ
jgi:hypothetical protein